MARSTLDGLTTDRAAPDRSPRPRRPGIPGALCGRIAPALACAAALLTAPDRGRAEEPEPPAERPTITADDFLNQRDADDPAARVPLPDFAAATAFDAEHFLSPAVDPTRAASGGDFWHLRNSLFPSWNPRRDNPKRRTLLQGRAFDVAYGVRFDKRERFDLMASWGMLTLGAGKMNGGFTGFGGVMLPLDPKGATLRLGAEVGKKGPRMMLGLDIPLGGRD